MWSRRRSLTARQKRIVFALDWGFCRYCGKSLHFAPSRCIHYDHELAYSRGWPTAVWNSALSCRTCNLRKGARNATWWQSVSYTARIALVALAGSAFMLAWAA